MPMPTAPSWKARRNTRRINFRNRRGKSQPACKPGSVWPAQIRDLARTRQPFIWDACCQTPHATNPDSWPGNRPGPGSLRDRAVPIRSCSRWGLPCRRCCQLRGGLLPHPFTLTPQHASRPVQSGLLSVALSLRSPSPGVTRHRVSMEPGLSSPAAFRRLRQRLSGRLAFADLSGIVSEVKQATGGKLRTSMQRQAFRDTAMLAETPPRTTIPDSKRKKRHQHLFIRYVDWYFLQFSIANKNYQDI